MSALLRRTWAFVVRDFKEETSYRLAFVMQLGGLLWMMIAFWYIAKLVGSSPLLASTGGSWFSFVLLGYAPLEFLRVGVMGFSSGIRDAQAHGTLEALLVTRAGLPTIVFGSVAYAYIRAAVRSALFLLVGTLAAGMTGDFNAVGVLAFLVLSIACFGAIGILSASFVMVFKKGDPISMVVLGTSTLFAGLLFPPQLLGKLEIVSKALPLTYAMEGVRLAVAGRPWDELGPLLIVLLLFCAALIPLAAWSFRAALDRARRDGTLSHY